ncbi:uncharacterized protein GIQ15_06420 [Arthroderma uncinatum]|uniref:uncharacterized protein n=1 Tax=Arthroderma uncinatum TaxID=74035 RepID=UPI00144A6B68|nr:uncharacterized protein GIQ15_06420 [Arthroderma uncinatum]KAF3479444.1 hypothetical protein GIQ15_06420 [Arthroderma uncinatum]
MLRWHERFCRHPDVVQAYDAAYCKCCKAMPMAEVVPKASSPILLPPLGSSSRMNLTWPSVTEYSGVRLPPKRNRETGQHSLGQQHQKLPQTPSPNGFRLLRLSPRQHDAPIHAEFEIREMGSGQGVAQRVWVDALCIDLADAEDKNQQTALMRNIYSSALNVITYIDTPSESAGQALTCMEKLIRPRLSTPNEIIMADIESKKELHALFRRPFFYRLWIMSEMLLAQTLWIIYGKRSILWPRCAQTLHVLMAFDPAWLNKANLWSEANNNNVLRMLLHSSIYKCSDPRDKVFGLLSLLDKKHITPDYRLSVEAVYTGISAYLVKNCSAFDTLSLAGIYKKRLDMPSWVPDWSQKLTLRVPDENYFTSMGGLVGNTAARVVFENIFDTDTEAEIDVNTGAMTIPAIKLCGIPETIMSLPSYHKVLVKDMGARGLFRIVVLEPAYEIGNDSLFLLNGWEYPVILRHHPGQLNSYELVATCAIFLGPPSSGEEWLVPWTNARMFPHSDTTNIITASGMSQKEKCAIRELYHSLSTISSTSRPESTDSIPFQDMKRQVLEYLLLSSTRLRGTESKLKIAWDRLKQTHGYLFQDQRAVYSLLLKALGIEGDNGNVIGSGIMRIDNHDVQTLKRYGQSEFPSAYSWSLGQFCWSFLDAHFHNPLPLENPPLLNPTYIRMCCQIPDIMIWAKITEQLFKVLEYSQNTPREGGIYPPGADLFAKWRSKWDNFQAVEIRSDQPSGDPDKDRFWSWADFDETWIQRQKFWNQEVPKLLDPSTNSNMATRLGLTTMGLQFDDQQYLYDAGVPFFTKAVLREIHEQLRWGLRGGQTILVRGLNGELVEFEVEEGITREVGNTQSAVEYVTRKPRIYYQSVQHFQRYLGTGRLAYCNLKIYHDLALRDKETKEFIPMGPNPAYSSVDSMVLSDFEISTVEDPVGFLMVDSRTVVISCCPDIPVRQIITDIARPAMIFWDANASEDAHLPDPASSRVRNLLGNFYDRHTFPADRTHFHDLTMYTRKGGGISSGELVEGSRKLKPERRSDIAP